MEEQKEESPKRPKGRQKKDLGRRTSREKTSELNLEKFKGSKEDEYDMLIHAIRNPRDSLIHPKRQTTIENIQENVEKVIKRSTKLRTKVSTLSTKVNTIFGKHVEPGSNKNNQTPRYSEKFRKQYFPQEVQEDDEKSSTTMGESTKPEEAVVRILQEFEQKQNLQIGDIKEVMTETEMSQLDTSEMNEMEQSLDISEMKEMEQNSEHKMDSSEDSSTVIPDRENSRDRQLRKMEARLANMDARFATIEGENRVKTQQIQQLQRR
eukprot:scaffold1589_cov96-Cylindrotheca_fusiformis.AAC.1